MNRILVPTDFSFTAENGLKLAVDIARHINGEIILLNIIFPVHGTTFTAMGDISTLERGEADHFMAELVRKNRSRLDETIRKYGSDDVKIIPQIDFEDKTNGLNSYVKRHDLDFIVIGTRGSKSLTEYLFGSQTENLVKVSDCPVISVKESVNDFYPEDIVFAVDVNNKNFQGMKELKRFADKFQSEIHLLYIMDDRIQTDEAISKLQQIAEANKFSNYTINTAKNSDPEDAIKSYSKRKSADMLALISEGKTGIRELIFGSVTNDIINSSEVPVFVIG